MTTFREVEVRCAICGELSRVAELTSTSVFGPPDLDLRPMGPARWALEMSVQRCRSCGYCARSLGKAPPGAAAVVESPVYQGVRQDSKLPRLARDYFCRALVAEASGYIEGAAHSFLEAAWACDDKGAAAQARICRERSAEMLERALASGDHEPPREVVLTVLADVRRRAGWFADALAACDEAEQALEDTPDSDSVTATAAVIEFIRERAEAGDDDCYNAAEAFAAEE
jgi:hypothetical protein